MRDLYAAWVLRTVFTTSKGRQMHACRLFCPRSMLAALNMRCLHLTAPPLALCSVPSTLPALKCTP